MEIMIFPSRKFFIFGLWMWKYHPDLIEVTPQHHYSHFFHILVFFHIRSACSSFFRLLVTTNRKLTGSSMSESAFSQDERVTRQTIQLRFKITEAKAKKSVQEARGPDVEDLKTCGLWPLSLRDPPSPITQLMARRSQLLLSMLGGAVFWIYRE